MSGYSRPSLLCVWWGYLERRPLLASPVPDGDHGVRVRMECVRCSAAGRSEALVVTISARGSRMEVDAPRGAGIHVRPPRRDARAVREDGDHPGSPSPGGARGYPDRGGLPLGRSAPAPHRRGRRAAPAGCRGKPRRNPRNHAARSGRDARADRLGVRRGLGRRAGETSERALLASDGRGSGVSGAPPGGRAPPGRPGRSHGRGGGEGVPPSALGRPAREDAFRRSARRTLRGAPPPPPFFSAPPPLDGKAPWGRPGRGRSGALGPGARGRVVPRGVTADPASAQAFLAESLARGHEGVMAKAVEAAYEAGRRGLTWIKVKPSHTLDLVVLAAEWGHGRRTGFLSNIHLGARVPVTGAFLMLGKTFKGMTDAMLEWQTKRFRELEVATDGSTVELRPEQVVEVAFSDVQESPHYPAGLALRFARVKRYRDDKRAEDADTIETVRAIHARSLGQPGL